jgi:hypothetical protein
MKRSPQLPLLTLALAHILIFVAGLLAFGLLSRGERLPTPMDPSSVVQKFYQTNGLAIRVGALLQFVSALPLALWAIAVSERGRGVEGGTQGDVIAWFGGWGAALMLLLTGLCAWVAADPDVASSASNVRSFQLLSFVLGGPGFAVLFALLITGVLVGSHGSGPRWLVWLGVVCACCGLLAAFTLVSLKAAVFLPLTRFPGFVWLLGAARAFRAPRPRHG